MIIKYVHIFRLALLPMLVLIPALVLADNGNRYTRTLACGDTSLTAKTTYMGDQVLDQQLILTNTRTDHKKI